MFLKGTLNFYAKFQAVMHFSSTKKIAVFKDYILYRSVRPPIELQFFGIATHVKIPTVDSLIQECQNHFPVCGKGCEAFIGVFYEHYFVIAPSHRDPMGSRNAKNNFTNEFRGRESTALARYKYSFNHIAKFIF